MQKNNSQILDHLQKLLLEINFHRPDEDVFDETGYQDNDFVKKHLRQIKLKMAKVKAEHNKGGFRAIMEEVRKLRQIGIEEINKLLNPEQRLQYQPLFRKFEDLSEKDEASILEDSELLQIISVLKDKLSRVGESDENN